MIYLKSFAGLFLLCLWVCVPVTFIASVLVAFLLPKWRNAFMEPFGRGESESNQVADSHAKRKVSQLQYTAGAEPAARQKTRSPEARSRQRRESRNCQPVLTSERRRSLGLGEERIKCQPLRDLVAAQEAARPEWYELLVSGLRKLGHNAAEANRLAEKHKDKATLEEAFLACCKGRSFS